MLAPRAFVKRVVGAGELRLYHHLSRLASQYNDGFTTLVLPAPLEVDRRRHRLKLPFYAGEHFDERWDEGSGGARPGVDLAVDMAGIIGDLLTIATAPLLEEQLLMAIPKVAYGDAEAVAHAMGIARALAEAGYLNSRARPRRPRPEHSLRVPAYLEQRRFLPEEPDPEARRQSCAH